MEPLKRHRSKRSSLFQEIFSTANTNDQDAVVGHILQQASPVQSPATSRRGSSQEPTPLPGQSATSLEKQNSDGSEDNSLWFESARNGVSWGQSVVISYVIVGISGAFLFWWQNGFMDSFFDCIFMTMSAITGSSLSTILLQNSSFGALLTINILAFISSPTWSDLLFVIIWYRKVSFLLKDSQSQQSEDVGQRLAMAKAIHALKLEKGASFFALIFLLSYTFIVVIFCTIVGGLYLSFALDSSFPDKCFGYSCFWVSWFDSVGNFANSGFTLNPAGYIVYANHPFLPLLMCFCMSSGIMFRTSYMTVLLSLFRRLSRSESLTTYCDHFFSHSVILRTLFDLNSPQLASFFYNVLITCGCTAYFFIAESHQRSSLTGTDASFNQVVMFLFLAMSVRWSGTTVMDLSQIGLGSQLLMFCVLGLIEVPFDKCDRGSTTLSSYLRRFTLGANALYVAVPLGWIILCQIGSMNSFNSFNCMFEVMSAFFNSGVTIANQDNPDLASLSYIGSLPNASKMILLLVMLAGRFRKVSALPQACKEAIQSWKASPDSVLDMRKLNSGVGSVAFAQSEGHLEPAIAELLKLIDNVPAIKSLSSSQRIQLCRVLTTRSFSDEECIIRQGDVGDSAFIIISGSVSIRKSIGPGDPEIPLVVLQKGAFFGELALMHNAPRGASAYSEGISDCIVVSKSAFDSIRDAVSSELKERELGYVRSEVEALTLKIKRLEAELLALRRRKSSHEFCLPTTLSSDNVMLTTRGTPVIPSDALEVSSNSEPFPENLPLPGAATVDIQSSPIPFRQLERTSRPVFKSRRTLLPLPSETPRL